MKFTIGWLKEHLDTKFNDNEIIDKLTDVGLEVESFERVNSNLDNFKACLSSSSFVELRSRAIFSLREAFIKKISCGR